MLTYVIIILFSIAVGMVIGLLTRPNIIYEGPNSEEEVHKIFYDKEKHKCFKFNIQPLSCPKRKLFHF